MPTIPMCSAPRVQRGRSRMWTGARGRMVSTRCPWSRCRWRSAPCCCRGSLPRTRATGRRRGQRGGRGVPRGAQRGRRGWRPRRARIRASVCVRGGRRSPRWWVTETELEVPSRQAGRQAGGRGAGARGGRAFSASLRGWSWRPHWRRSRRNIIVPRRTLTIRTPRPPRSTGGRCVSSPQEGGGRSGGSGAGAAVCFTIRSRGQVGTGLLSYGRRCSLR